MKKQSTLLVLLCLILLLTLLVGCGKKEPVSLDGPEKPVSQPVETEPVPEPEPIRNPLTGEVLQEDISAQRPYAVILNNISVALPQFGVSQADIIYEVVAEGGVTRMLGVFQDVRKLGSIGSIRSARPYYIDLAQGHDAVFVHAGGSPQAYTDLRNKGIDHVDGVNGNTPSLFFRDKDRIRSAGYEHSMFTTGELLTEVCGSIDSIRKTHADGWKYGQAFSEDAVPTGADAPLVRAYFPGGKKTSFEYDTETKLYKVYEYGAPYVDGADGKQVGVTNVLCLFTDVSHISGDNKGRMAVRTTGSGTGIFACGGKSAEIKWERATVNDPFVYTNADGSPLTLGVGHSFVCVLGSDSKVTLTADAE